MMTFWGNMCSSFSQGNTGDPGPVGYTGMKVKEIWKWQKSFNMVTLAWANLGQIQAPLFLYFILFSGLLLDLANYVVLR